MMIVQYVFNTWKQTNNVFLEGNREFMQYEGYRRGAKVKVYSDGTTSMRAWYEY
jgi:hypothetical protein